MIVRIANTIIDHRFASFMVLLAVSAVAMVGHYDPQILLPEPQAQTVRPQVAESEAENAAADEERIRSAPSVNTVQVAANDVIIVAECDDFFTPDAADALRAAVAAVEELPQVSNVLWMDRAPMMNIFGLPEPILPSRNASELRFDQALQRAIKHPLVSGQLLSEDGRTTLLMVTIDWLFVMQDSDCTDAIRDAASKAASAFPNAEMRFRVTGEVPIRVSRSESTRENEFKYQLIGYSMALVIAFVLFRGLSAVVIVAFAPALGVFWTLGALHFLGWDDNPFNSVIVPVLLCMVGFTDGVHMMVQIRRHRHAGLSSQDAAKRAIHEVGLACWLTSFTTVIGFGSLALAHHEVVREFGYCCVIGVLLTFVSVITVIPLCCASPLGRRIHRGHERNWIDRHLGPITSIVDYVLSHPKRFSIIAVIGTLILSVCTLQLRPDERLSSNLASNSEAAMALDHIDKSLGGMESARIRVHWNRECEDDDGEIAEVIEQVQSLINREDLLSKPLSIVSLIDALPGEGRASDRMSLLDLLPPPLKRAYYQPERRYADVAFRLQDLGIATYGPVFERLESGLSRIMDQHQRFELELLGRAVWRWKDLYRIVVDLAWSLGTASVIIFAVLTLVYRSLRLGLISIVPNLFPLATTGTLLLLVGQDLEIVSVCAFTVCLGIAVDDTIHFLTRFREEQLKTEENREALRRAFVGVGSALIITTIVLVIGFSTALTSDTRDHRIFAFMGILTITSALFADMVFLPALLLKFAPKRVHTGGIQDKLPESQTELS